MASLWPPLVQNANVDANVPIGNGGFEREGDKMYLAAEVLQGKYGKETDIFSFGMMMLETAANIVVPAQGELWHRLREEDFSPVESFEEECSCQLVHLIKRMMSKDPERRPAAETIYSHPVVTRARARMDLALETLKAQGDEVLFKASPLAGVEDGFLRDILGHDTGADGWTC